MKQNCRRGVLTASRIAVNSHPHDIHFGMPGTRGFHPEDAVSKTAIFEVMKTHIMKCFRSVCCPHAIDLHHNESQIRQRRETAGSAKCFRHERTLRPRVDALDDRIFSVRVQIPRAVNQSPNVSLAIASFGDKNFGRLKAFFSQLGNIRLLQFADQFSV